MAIGIREQMAVTASYKESSALAQLMRIDSEN